jgi:hypothetical protein
MANTKAVNSNELGIFIRTKFNFSNNIFNRHSNVAALPEKAADDTVQFVVVGDVYSRFTTLARILR